MSDREPEQDQPSLELPSLGGWRRRRRAQRSEPAPAADPTPDPTPDPAPDPASGEQATVRRPETVADAPPPEPAPDPAPAPEPVSGGQSTVLVTETAEEPPPPARRVVRVRRPAGYVAVLGTGLLVGLLMVGMTWGSLRTCEQVQGTSSCGAAGYPMLLFVLVLAVVAGGMLLRLLQVADPVSTSFLGTGLATVLALLFLVDQLDSPAMVAVVPLLTAACFAGAHWVTATFIEPGDR